MCIRDRLCKEYEVEPAQIHTDLLVLAQALADAGLVKLRAINYAPNNTLS